MSKGFDDFDTHWDDEIGRHNDAVVNSMWAAWQEAEQQALKDKGDK